MNSSLHSIHTPIASSFTTLPPDAPHLKASVPAVSPWLISPWCSWSPLCLGGRHGLSVGRGAGCALPWGDHSETGGTMNSRQRLLAAITGGTPDRLPCAPQLGVAMAVEMPPEEWDALRTRCDVTPTIVSWVTRTSLAGKVHRPQGASAARAPTPSSRFDTPKGSAAHVITPRPGLLDLEHLCQGRGRRGGHAVDPLRAAGRGASRTSPGRSVWATMGCWRWGYAPAFASSMAPLARRPSMNSSPTTST